MVNRPVNRAVSPFVRAELFRLRNIGTRCAGLSVTPRGLRCRFGGALSGLSKFGVAVPRGRTIVPFLSRVSTGTRVCNDIGAISGGGNVSGNCAASPSKFLGTLSTTKVVLGNEVMVVNYNNITEAVTCRIILGGRSLLFTMEGRSLGVTRTLYSRVEGAITNYSMDFYLVSRLSNSVSILVGTAPVKVCPGVRGRPMDSDMVGHYTGMFSTICGPLRAVLIGGTETGNTATRDKVTVLM